MSEDLKSAWVEACRRHEFWGWAIGRQGVYLMTVDGPAYVLVGSRGYPFLTPEEAQRSWDALDTLSTRYMYAVARGEQR